MAEWLTNISGSYGELPYRETTNENDMWERMYVRPKPVIIVCRYCGSHNATGNPVCIQCGAPFGRLYD